MQWVLWVALAASVAALFIPWRDLSKDLGTWIPRAIVLLQIQPFLILTFLFIVDSTTYDLVRLYGGGSMPLLYKISAVWASREGPILLWAGLIALCGLFFQIKGRGDSAILMRKIVNGVVLTILTLALIMRPFRLAQSTWRGELNPLLQTDLMVLHPPLIYLFYSLCIIVMIQALTFILSEEDIAPSKFKKDILPAARAAFAVGTLGIGLGGLWAYTVLDWGGYWAWDPVETASLLPWVCLLLLLHLRVSPGKKVAKWAIPLAILPGWFTIHATMVTRANGVWTSVHTFVSDELNGRSDTAIGRVIDLQGEGVAGTEITTYLIALITILITTIAWLVTSQTGLGDEKRWRLVSRYSLFFILVIPLSRFVTVDLFGAEISWIELLPSVLLFLLASSSIIALISPPNTILPNLFDNNEKLFSMVAILLLSYFIQDMVVAFLLCILMILKISEQCNSGIQSENANGNLGNFWAVAAVIVILTATYAFLIEVTIAGIALLIFLWPILLKESDEEEQSLKDRLLQFCTRKEQMRLALYTPIMIGAIFLSLTWMLMIASIDGASLAMHEMFGGPLILLVAAALATYSWKDTVPSKWIPMLLLGFIALGIILGNILNLPLTGDSNAQFSEVVSRGDVAWLLLPMMIVAIPSLIRLTYDLSRKTIEGYSTAKLRSSLAHAAHVGILLLLVGHIFTTTLVDRTDSSHQVILVQDDQVTHDGLHLTFIEWTILSSDDEDFSERFKVGDGFIGAEIEVRDEAGTLLGTVNPGMLRFDDSNGFPRSEVARHSTWTGDTIFIFDWSQTQELGNASDTIDMASGEMELDRVRLTVYHLPGSHLVWAGWLIIMLSTFTLWISSIPRSKEAKTTSAET